MQAEEIREKAHSVCADYLDGVWKSIQPNDIIIEPILGGFINYMFKLALPSNCTPVGNEPKQVLMKNFSDNLKIGKFGIMSENIVVILLGKRKLAPQVYGVFDGGRLDEFIDGRVLTSSDFRNPVVLDIIVKKLALLHSLKPPLTKNPEDAINKLEGFFGNSLQSISEENFKDNIEKLNFFKKFESMKPDEEFQWLKSLRDEVMSPVVFSHGDFHMNNMLIRTTPNCLPEDLICFVDYELCGYNYRAFDICRIMGCFVFDLLPDPPYFTIQWENHPSDEKKKEILRIYLEEYQKITNCNFKMDEEIEKLFQEVEAFSLMSHFLGILFSIVKPFKMIRELDFFSFGDVVFDFYNKAKEEYIKKFRN